MFPMTVAEIIRFARESSLGAPTQRLAVHLENERGLSEFGPAVAGYYPGCAIVVFSIDCNEHFEGAKHAVIIGLDQFASIEREGRPAKVGDVSSDKVELSWWAYRGALGKLNITKRVRRARSRSFRGGGRLLSGVRSPKKSDTHEAIVTTVQSETGHWRDA